MSHATSHQGDWPRPLPIQSLPIAFVAFLVGFALVLSAPYVEGPVSSWLVPFIGSYRLTPFELFVLPLAYISILSGRWIRVSRREASVYLAVALMIVASSASLVFAEHMQLQQVVAIARYLETMMVIYVTARLSSRANSREWLLIGIMCAVWVETLGGLAMYLAYSSEGGRGVFLGINSFMLMTFAVLLYLGQAASGKPVLVRVLSASLLMIAILLTVTRSAWIFLIVALLVAGVFWGRTVIRLLAGVLGAVCVVVGALLVVWPSLFQLVVFRFTQFGESGGVIIRLYLWDRALGAFLTHPFFGIGSGGLSRQLEQLPSRFGFRLTGEYAEMEAAHRAHNLFLGLLAEMGIVGLAAYLVWVITVGVLCLRILRSWRSGEVDEATAAGAVIIVTSLLSDFWSEGSFIAMSSTFIGFLLGSLALRRSMDGRVQRATSRSVSGSG